MDKNEKRSVIKYLHLKGLSPQQIYLDMSEVLGDDAPSQATVYRWVAEFRRGRQSTEDEHRCGRPLEASTEENVDLIQDMVLADRRVTIQHIAETLNISTGTAHHIMSDVLGYSKVCARLVPRMLTPEMKRVRVQTSVENLRLYRANPEEFCCRYVTMDETWAHHFDPETKQQSMQWKHTCSPVTFKFRQVASAGKVMASVFWDIEGVLMIDYMEQGKTVTGAYYATLINQLRSTIKQKRRGKLSRGILLHHDNAPAHTSHVAMAAIRDCGFQLLSQPPYSPDLAPSDYHLFRYLKDSLRGRVFQSDDDVIHAIDDWIGVQEPEFFQRGVEALEHRWEKCIALRGDYVEKL